jgi:hypothetical protein
MLWKKISQGRTTEKKKEKRKNKGSTDTTTHSVKVAFDLG